MKALLNAVKAHLPGELPYLKGVYVLGLDEEFPPESATPAVGLTDGGTVVAVHDVVQIVEDLTVHADIFVENLRSAEAPVLGDAQARGLLDIAADLRTALNDQLFGDPPHSLSVAEAYVVREEPPVLFIFPDAGKEILKKRVTFQYRRFRPR